MAQTVLNFDETQNLEPVQPELVEPIVTNKDLAANWFLGGKIYRAPMGNGRYYFREGFPEFYSGYSTWTKNVLPTAYQLIEWQVRMGLEGKTITLAAREYGHIFHLLVARHERQDDEFTFKVRYPEAAEWRDLIRQTVAQNGLPPAYIETWEAQLQNDMVAYFNWKQLHQVQVLAVEAPVWSDKYKIATPADLVCKCLVKASPYAKKPTIPAVVGVDFKSGENSVAYDAYQLQLEFIRMAWNERYRKTPWKMTHIYNWAPKKRALSPGGFNFVDQSGKYTMPQVRHYCTTNAIMGFNVPSGEVLYYTDGKNGPELKRVAPLDWLKVFFGKK